MDGSIPFALFEDEVCKILGVSRSIFKQSIAPIMFQRGDARKVKKSIIFSGREIWMWKEYIRKRRLLIDMKEKGWHSKRPYSLQDFDDLVVTDMYEDL